MRRAERYAARRHHLYRRAASFRQAAAVLEPCRAHARLLPPRHVEFRVSRFPRHAAICRVGSRCHAAHLLYAIDMFVECTATRGSRNACRATRVSRRRMARRGYACRPSHMLCHAEAASAQMRASRYYRFARLPLFEVCHGYRVIYAHAATPIATPFAGRQAAREFDDARPVCAMRVCAATSVMPITGRYRCCAVTMPMPRIRGRGGRRSSASRRRLRRACAHEYRAQDHNGMRLCSRHAFMFFRRADDVAARPRRAFVMLYARRGAT